MALISRWELSNFLNSGKQARWRPDFVGEVFDFGGGSTAVVMDNGTGKTSITDAVLFLLSQDRALLDRTKSRFAKQSTEFFTHVRIEFVLPRDASQRSLLSAFGEPADGGEYHVFGLFGNRLPSESLDYKTYHYQGRLEDCPVHVEEEIDGDIVKSLRDDTAFVDNLKDLGVNVHKRNMDLQAELAEFVSAEQVRQLVDYQKQGGGDKSASFYAVTARKNETFDRAFFRQHIAPRLLSGNIEMLVDNEHRALPMEEGIVRQARAVVQAKLRTEQKAREVDDMAKVGRFLDAIRAKGDDWLAARDALKQVVERDGATVSAVKALVERWDLPGAPLGKAAMQRHAGEWDKLHACAVRPGGGVAVEKDAAAVVFGLKDTVLRGLAVYDDRQVIPLTVDRIYRGRSGADDRRRYFDMEEILGALPDEGQDSHADLARRALVDMDAFVTAHLAAPPRREARAATAAHNALQTEAEQVRVDRDELSTRRGKLSSEVESLSLLEAAYKELCASKLFKQAFTSAADVREAKRSAEGEQAEAEKKLQTHRSQTSRFEVLNGDYLSVRKEFGTGDLDALLVDLRDAVDTATEKRWVCDAARAAAERREKRTRALSEARAKAIDAVAEEAADLKAKGRAWSDLVAAFPGTTSADGLWRDLTAKAEDAETAKKAADALVDQERGASAQAEKELVEAERSRDALTQEQDRLKAVAPAGRRFAAEFPDYNPAAFEEQLNAAIQKHEDQAAEQSRECARLAPLVASLTAFREKEPERSPHQWLDDVAKERQALTLRLSKAAETARTLWAQLQQVRRDKAAPTDVDLKALALIADLPGPRPLHEVLKVEERDQGRLSAVLSALSAVLHAPVFNEPGAAREAAKRLAEAQIPVPVLVLADVRCALADGRLSVTEDEGLYRALFAGLQTDAVRAVVDPSFFREQAKRLAGQLRDVLGERRALRARQAEIAEGATDVLLAQNARRAIDEAAESALASAQSARDAAQAEAERLRGLLTPETRDLAHGAAKFLSLGGEERLAAVAEDLMAAEAECERKELEKQAAEERFAQAEARQEEAGTRLDEARERRGLWQHRCEEAIAFQAAGGAGELDRLMAEEARLRARKTWFDTQVDVRERLSREAAEASRAAERAHGETDKRLARWEEPLKKAIDFEREGGPDFLATAAGVEETLVDAHDTAAERCGFRFEEAARFLEDGGAEGAQRRLNQLAELDRRLTALNDRAEDLSTRLPKAEKHASRLRAEAQRYENDLLAVVQAYPPVDRFTAGKGSGLTLPDPTVLPTDTPAGQLLAAATALAEGAMDTADMAGAMAGLRERLEALKPEAAVAALRAAIDRNESAGQEYRAEHARSLGYWKEQRLGPAVLREEVERCGDDPAALAEHANGHAVSHQTQIRLLDDLREKEEKSRDQLHGLLANHVTIAADNMNILRRVLAEGGGATFEIHNPEAAPMAALEAMLGRVVDHVRERERRWREESGREQEEEHLGRMFAKAKDEIYDVMFPNARIKVRHPMMRGGDAFFYDKGTVSGGQNTALNLLWSIKLASFAVARDAARLPSGRRRQARAASHSILIVDGLFSDLSEPNLIAESLDAMRDIRGNFQLIGLIHSPYYRNDWEFFPTCITGRAVRTIDDTGTEGRMVAVQSHQESEGRVRALGLRAVRELS
jgi:hypothetical protein